MQKPDPDSPRVVLVTGGAGGLGAAICKALGGEGWSVAIADRDTVRARELASSLNGGGSASCFVEADVGSDESARHAVAAVTERFGRIDALVNNAAIDVTSPLDQLSVADWNRVVSTNLTGPFLMSKHALAGLRAARGAIVNVASTASRRTWPNAVAYHATKWGLLGLSHALHAELRGDGIKVTAVIAGGMRTPFLLDRFPDIDPGVLQDPANVARAVAFALTQPAETVIPEIMVLPMRETSWP